MAAEPADKVVSQLQDAMFNLVRLKIRLPTLKAIVQEFAVMGDGENSEVRNDVAMQFVRDAFDMLVIDLASLCESLTDRGGAFESLKDDCVRLRRYTVDDISEGAGWIGAPPANADYFETVLRKDLADRRNQVFDRLFPGRETVAPTDIEALVTRFRKAVEPTDRDRNRVRAHRFERHVDNSYFQPPEQAEAQLTLVEGYVNDLLLVLSRTTYSTHALALADARETATDLADIVVHGSIDAADRAYADGGSGSARAGYAARRAVYFARKQSSSA